MEQKFKCQYCNKGFGQDWSKSRHEKLCKEKKLALEKHPERYSSGKK